MRVNAINMAYSKPTMKKSTVNNLKQDTVKDQLQADTVSFKGSKNAVKGFCGLGILRAGVGAIVSGGTSLLPTIAYFAITNGLIGAAAGAQLEDD